jgi:hypothetical protein
MGGLEPPFDMCRSRELLNRGDIALISVICAAELEPVK